MFYEQVTALCEKKGISISKMVQSIGLSKSNATEWKKGSVPKADTLKKIADYFGVTTDFLLYGKDMAAINASNIANSAIVQGNHATTLIVKNGKTEERELMDQEIELLRIYNSLDIKKQIALLSYAYKLEDGSK